MTADGDLDARRRAWSRRGFLRAAGLGAAGAAVAACAPSAAPAPAPAKPAVAPPTPPTTAGQAPAPVLPAQAAWVEEWERVLAAAKREGVVVVAGPPGDLYRQALVAFEKSFPDIKAEFTGASGRDLGPKLIAERDAGQYLLDIHVGGTTTGNVVLKPRGTWDPLKPALIRPDVLDDANWVGGFNAGFTDKEATYSYGFEANLRATVHVNRDVVPESELSRFEQLLEPRWRGRMSWNDPRLPGNGGSTAGHLLMVSGDDFYRRLLQQEPTVTSDLRQQVEWIVRGTYPVAAGMDETFLAQFTAQGLGQNVKPLDITSAPGGRLEIGFGTCYLANRAPHPNAARIYLNWLLSQEGQQSWTVTRRSSRRRDVANPPETTPDPNVTYRSVNHEDNSEFEVRALEVSREVLK
jgi:iron(III) transport system substrate-binding protein